MKNLNKENFNSLNEFLEFNSGNPVIAIQGLGFVGSVMSLVCANSPIKDYAVIGVDLDNSQTRTKIDEFNKGVFPLIAEDPKILEYFKSTKLKKNFFATTDELAYCSADVIIVDINLDVVKHSSKDNSLHSFDVNLSSFQQAISTIGKYCKQNALVLVETTVPPGTCEKIIYPTLNDEFKKRNLSIDKLNVAHSYERVMPGPEYIDSIQNFPRVYSGIDDKSADAAEAFLKTIINSDKCELTRLKSTTASEMAKVLENSYRASNIAFAVEWSRFAEEADVDLWSIVDAIRVRKTHANLMYP